MVRMQALTILLGFFVIAIATSANVNANVNVDDLFPVRQAMTFPLGWFYPFEIVVIGEGYVNQS